MGATPAVQPHPHHEHDAAPPDALVAEHVGGELGLGLGERGAGGAVVAVDLGVAGEQPLDTGVGEHSSGKLLRTKEPPWPRLPW